MAAPSQDKSKPLQGLVGAIIILAALSACLCCCVTGAFLSAYWLLSESIDERLDGTPEPTPAPSQFYPASPPGDSRFLEQRILQTETSDTDYWRLFGLLESVAGEPANRGPVQGPTELHAGEVHTLWMGDEEEQRYWQLDAELYVKTDHAYFFVSEGTEFDAAQLAQAADLFESQIRTTNHRYFGTEWSPGIDNDPRTTILVTDQMPPGLAGYFSSADEYPTAMKPRSNEREMIYVTVDYLDDLDLFGHLLSHEFQHMSPWNQDRSESLWLNEGLSLLAEEVNGYTSVLGAWDFWLDPDIQLTNWAEDSADQYRNYAASKLFVSYLGEHYGGYEALGALAADDAYGIDGINRLLQSGQYQTDFPAVFGDWVVANLLNDKLLDDGRYGYSLHDGGEPTFGASLGQNTEYAGWVRQFGADYIEILPGAGSAITFTGSGLVRLAGTDPHRGAVGEFAWWSNRRNMLESSLTRTVDLGRVNTATLHYWSWHDIEEGFDYGYVAASSDGGRTWETLPGSNSTSDNPNQANYGHGYTGKSLSWRKEEVDLTGYAGQLILVRFWYISDPGLNQPGWLIDDISIPEIGFCDDAESLDSGWTVEGFVRSSNYLPQSYLLQLVEYGPQVRVRRLGLDADNSATIERDSTHRAVLVISGATRWTSEPAPYRVRIEP